MEYYKQLVTFVSDVESALAPCWDAEEDPDLDQEKADKEAISKIKEAWIHNDL